MILSDLLAAVAPARPPRQAAGEALRDLRSCLPYLTAAGEERLAELSFPELAWLTKTAGANKGAGYAPQTLFNAERAYKYPTPGVVAAYAHVAELARRPGWVEETLASLAQEPEGGRWRRASAASALMADAALSE